MAYYAKQILTPNQDFFISEGDDLLRDRLQGPTDWEKLEEDSRGEIKVSFSLDIDFNKTAAITVYDFLFELNQIFSKSILPVRVDNGCINVVAQLEDARDYKGVDFRERLISDEEYQEILSAYAVTGVTFFGFPFDNRFPSDHMKVDEQGHLSLK